MRKNTPGGSENFQIPHLKQGLPRGFWGRHLFAETSSIGTNTPSIAYSYIQCKDSINRSEKELRHLKWDIVGIAEVRRILEDQIKLKSGNILHYKGEE